MGQESKTVLELQLVKDLGDLRLQITSVELSPDECLLAVASFKSTRVCVFDVSSGEQKWSVLLQSYQAVFSPDGSRVGAADYSGSCVKIFCSESGAWLRTLSGHSSVACGVAWSSTGIIASGSADRTVRLWNPNSGVCLQTLSGHSSYVDAVSFSPDGSRLASGDRDTTVRIWDVESGKCLHTLTGHTHFVWRVAFSPDGSKLASTSSDDTVRIWDAFSNFACIRKLDGAGSGSWRTIAWTPDSRILASANESSLQLWDESGASILQVNNPASAVTLSRFSHDIITGSKDGKASCWKSPITWPLFFDVKNGIPFGKLHLPPKSSHEGYTVSETLERISTIIERMDPPSAFFDQIKLLHELNNNSSFVDMQTRARVARDLEQGFGKLIDQRQAFNDAQTSLHQKASHRQRLDEVKEDLDKLDASSHFFSCIKEHLKEYFQLPTSEEKETSFKQYEHSSPRDLSGKKLEDILSFAHKSHAKLARLERGVIDIAKSFEKALLDYDQYSAEIREQSEKNVDAITAFLAYRPSTSISSDLISEIERTLGELQVVLDNDADIMSKLDRSLSEYSSAKDQLNKSLKEQRFKKEQIDMQAASERSGRDSQSKGSSWMQILNVFGKAAPVAKESTNNIHQQEPPPLLPPIEVDDNSEHLRQQLEQAKSKVKSTAGIEQHAHLVYKWFNDRPDCKLDAAEFFDIVGVR